MTDEELRELVRAVVAERLGRAEPRSQTNVVVLSNARSHASHGLLRVLPGAEAGGSCIIEPHLDCTHCGFCQSLGH
jgi:hypothetical protein